MKIILKTVLILLVSCIISAQIQIEIIPGSNDRNPNVVVRGSDRAKTTDIDLQAFKLTETGVQKNLERQKIMWIKVGEVNINHASAFGYKDLYITLKTKSGRILRTNDRILKFKKNIIRNYGMSVKIVKPSLKRDVMETMITKWHEIEDISVGNEIKHIVGFNRLEHTSKYGHEDFANRIVTLEAEPEDEILLQPGESVKPELHVKETTLEVRVDYEVSLDGDIHFGYICPRLLLKRCLNHDHLGINDYFRRLDQSPVLKPYEIVTFTYHRDPQVIFNDVQKDTTVSIL